MNDQPHFSQFQKMGAPPPGPAGLQRLAPLLKVAATGGVIAAATLYALQVTLSDGWRPGSVAGDAAGDAVVHETNRIRDAKIAYERGMADADAQPKAKAQMDVIVGQKVLEERTQALSGLSSLAVASDVLCAGSHGVASVTDRNVPTPFRPRDAGDDWNDLARMVAGITCNLGNDMRQAVTASQLEAVRTAAAARGAPMTNGATPGTTGTIEAAAPVAPAPALRTLPATLDDVFAIASPTRHWPWDYVTKARDFVRTLPDDTQSRFFAGLDEGTGWDVLVDRVQAYQALPDTPLPVSASVAPPAAQPAPALRQAILRQGQLRIYSYGMPPADLDRINHGLDLHNGYTTVWYDRVAAYRQAHGG